MNFPLEHLSTQVVPSVYFPLEHSSRQFVPSVNFPSEHVSTHLVPSVNFVQVSLQVSPEKPLLHSVQESPSEHLLQFVIQFSYTTVPSDS